MARQVQVVIDVETARAVANFAKVAVASRKMCDTSAEAARRTTVHFDRVGSAVGVVARNLVGMAAGVASFDKLISAAEAYEAHLDRLSVKSNELAKSTIALAALQKPEMSRDAVKQAVLTGSRYGMNTAESTATVQLLQSLNNGDLKKALQESKTAFRLSQLGVDQASIQTIATQSYAKNVELAKMGGAFYAAAEISPLEIADIAKAAPAIVSYKDPMTGVAAIPAMAAGGVPVAQLQDATKDLGMALALPSHLVDRATADLKPMGYNYQDLTEIEQLQVLRQRIPDLDRSGDLSIPEVMKAGITEQQKARSLAIGINQLDTLIQAREAAEYVPADALDRTVERIRRENPELNAAMLSDQASALREYYTLYGPESEKARNFAARQQDKGLQLIDKGYGALVDDETGKPGYLGRAFGSVLGVESTQEEIDRGAAMWSGMSLPGSMPYPIRPKESYEVVSSIDRLTSTLDRNTTALEKGNATPTDAKLSGPKVEAKYAQGTNYVPEDQIAQLHRGEAVIPAHLNQVQVTPVEVRPADTRITVIGARNQSLAHNADFDAWNRQGGGQSDYALNRQSQKGGNANFNAWNRRPLQNANSRRWNGVDTYSEDSGYYTDPIQRNGDSGGRGRGAPQPIEGIDRLSDAIEENTLETKRLNDRLRSQGDNGLVGAGVPQPVSRGVSRGGL